MKLLSGILGLTLTSVVALASANAADIYRAEAAGGYKDGPAYVAQTWTGFYAGVNGGYAWDAGSSNVIATEIIPIDPSLAPSGGFGGGQLGYNWQRNRLVFGIEADLQGAGINDKATASLPGDSHIDGPIDATAKSSLDWFGTIRGRIGYTFDRSLVYFTGGFAFGGVKDKLSVTEMSEGTLLSATAKKDETATGFVVGGGLEYALSPAWSLKGEYQYIDLGSTKLAAAVTGDCCDFPSGSAKIDHTYHTVRVGLNYHVGQTYEPLK